MKRRSEEVYDEIGRELETGGMRWIGKQGTCFIEMNAFTAVIYSSHNFQVRASEQHILPVAADRSEVR
jgi:hypothetical protein